MIITTVLGEIKASNVGFCQSHEHLLISHGVSAQINSALWMDDIEKTTAEVLAYQESGGNTLVDAQPGGCNRMTQGLVDIARNTGVHILASTGFHKLIFYPATHWLYTMDVDQLASVFIHELCSGMYTHLDEEFNPAHITAKAGLIKTALDTEGLSPLYRKLFSAASTAAIATNKPLMVHIEKGSAPLKLFDFLISRGMSPHKLIFCHMDRAVPDITIHKYLLSQGVFFEFDTIGRYKYHCDETEISLFKNLIQLGFEDQLLFSLDTTNQRMKAYNKNAIGLDYLLKTFIPLMRENNISKNVIKKISHDNFIQAFGTHSPRKGKSA